jgi:hypothetical protein
MRNTTQTIEYTRVLPRDLFNEAKLLKCIGRLCLLIHDNLTPVPMSFEDSFDPWEGFQVALLEEGALTILNIEIKIKGKPFLFKTTYNSKANFPLYLQYEYVDYPVFDTDGNFDPEFVAFCETVNEQE